MAAILGSIIGAVGSIGSSALGAAAGSAQGAANREAADNIQGIFENFGAGTLGIVDDLLGVADDVRGIDNPRTPRAPFFKDEAAGLLREGNQLAVDLAQENRAVAVGEGNLESYEQLKSDALKMANYDFSPIPRDIMRSLDQSALSRGDTGLMGLSERLAFDQKLNLANVGENRFFRALGFDATFVPATLTADNLFERANQLAQFEQNENQRLFDNEIKRNALVADVFGSAAGTTLNVESTQAQGLTQAEMLRAGNNAGAIGLAGAGSTLGSVAGGLSGIFDAIDANRTAKRMEERSDSRFEVLASIARNNNAGSLAAAILQ